MKPLYYTANKIAQPSLWKSVKQTVTYTVGVNVRHVGFAELMARAVQGLGVCLEADCQH